MAHTTTKGGGLSEACTGMKSREIAVAFYDVTIESSSRKRGIDNPTGADIDSLFKAVADLMKGAERPRYTHRNKTILLEVMAWEHVPGKNEYHVLLNRADQDRPDVAFKDFSTRKTRMGGKTKTEGIDMSTHMIIRPNRNGKSALLLVTQGAKVGIAVLEQLFKALAKSLDEGGKHEQLFVMDAPSGAKGDTYRVRYAFTCLGHKGQTLAQDLARGELLQMELVSHKPAKFDSGGNLMVEATAITLKPALGFTGGLSAIKQSIKEGLSKEGNHYDSLRIRFKDHSLHPRTETFAINKMEEAFVRREYLTFPTDLQSSYTVLSKDIISAMQNLA